MKSNFLRALATCLTAASAFAANVPEVAAKPATRTFAERQLAAVSYMSISLESQQRSVSAQRRSVVRQVAAQHISTNFGQPLTPAPVMEVASIPCPALPATYIDSLVSSAATRTAVAPELIRSVMQQESAFHPCAVSSKGAMGLMQLMPATALDLGVTNPLDPTQNVTGGAMLLRRLMDYYKGDLSMTLGAYNAGPGRVDAAGGVPAIPETMNYVGRILSILSLTNPVTAAKANGQ